MACLTGAAAGPEVLYVQSVSGVLGELELEMSGMCAISGGAGTVWSRPL